MEKNRVLSQSLDHSVALLAYLMPREPIIIIITIMYKTNRSYVFFASCAEISKVLNSSLVVLQTLSFGLHFILGYNI